MTKCSLKTRIFDGALMKKVHCTVIIIQKNNNNKKQNKKTKCSHMEIGISKVYNVLIVLERTVNQFYVASIYNYNFFQDIGDFKIYYGDGDEFCTILSLSCSLRTMWVKLSYN